MHDYKLFTQYGYANYSLNNFNFQHVYRSFRRSSTSRNIRYFRLRSAHFQRPIEPLSPYIRCPVRPTLDSPPTNSVRSRTFKTKHFFYINGCPLDGLPFKSTTILSRRHIAQQHLLRSHSGKCTRLGHSRTALFAGRFLPQINVSQPFFIHVTLDLSRLLYVPQLSICPFIHRMEIIK